MNLTSVPKGSKSRRRFAATVLALLAMEIAGLAAAPYAPAFRPSRAPVSTPAPADAGWEDSGPTHAVPPPPALPDGWSELVKVELSPFEFSAWQPGMYLEDPLVTDVSASTADMARAADLIVVATVASQTQFSPIAVTSTLHLERTLKGSPPAAPVVLQVGRLGTGQTRLLNGGTTWVLFLGKQNDDSPDRYFIKGGTQGMMPVGDEARVRSLEREVRQALDALPAAADVVARLRFSGLNVEPAGPALPGRYGARSTQAVRVETTWLYVHQFGDPAGAARAFAAVRPDLSREAGERAVRTGNLLVTFATVDPALSDRLAGAVR
ncbi:MAG TPA: hypothetical protein VGK74_21140 [Symbiobacteriaceae bacterium]